MCSPSRCRRRSRLPSFLPCPLIHSLSSGWARKLCFTFTTKGGKGCRCIHRTEKRSSRSAEQREEETLAMATRLGKGTSVASGGREREGAREREKRGGKESAASALGSLSAAVVAAARRLRRRKKASRSSLLFVLTSRADSLTDSLTD